MRRHFTVGDELNAVVYALTSVDCRDCAVSYCPSKTVASEESNLLSRQATACTCTSTTPRARAGSHQSSVSHDHGHFVSLH